MISKNKLRLVLVVDDDYAIRKFLVMALENEGYRVEVAINGLEALNLIGQNGSNYYDLILLDMQMPVMDGWKFLPLYHQKEDSAVKAPVIIMTAALTLARYGTQIKADGYLSKPFNLEELLLVMKKYLPVAS